MWCVNSLRQLEKHPLMTSSVNNKMFLAAILKKSKEVIKRSF